MKIALAYKIQVNAQSFGARLNASQRGLPGFLHHFAQLTSELHAAAPFGQGGFDLQHLAAHFRPCQASRQTNFAFCGDTLLAELDRPEHLLHARRANYVLKVRAHAFRDELARHLTAAGAKLAFEIAHAGFARVVADDFQNAFVGEFKLLSAQSVGLRLFSYQMALGNL